MRATPEELQKIWEMCSKSKRAWIRELWLTGQYDEHDLDYLTAIDDKFNRFSGHAEREWRQQQRESMPKNERGWLEIFPEMEAVLPDSLAEWGKTALGAKKDIKDTVKELEDKMAPEHQWFCREIIKNFYEPVKLLAEANKQTRDSGGHFPIDRRLFKTGRIVGSGRQKNMVEVAEAYGVQLRKVGAVYRGLCPLHSERTPSLAVYQGSNRFVCFGCGAKGDAISFVQLIKNARSEMPFAN